MGVSERKGSEKGSLEGVLKEGLQALKHFCRAESVCPVQRSKTPKNRKTLTSLNKEVRPFFLDNNSIWSFPSVSSLSDYSIWRSWGLL